MRYKHIKEFVEKLEQNKQAASQTNAVISKAKQPRQSNAKPQVTLTPELKQAIYDCVPPQADDRVEQYIFNSILSQITDVEKFMKLNHSDIRHKLADQFIRSKTSRLNKNEIQQSIQSANSEIPQAELSREQENNYLKNAGVQIRDDIYQVTMTVQDSNNKSHISQQQLDAVAKNEGKRYDARKFDSVIKTLYHTESFAVSLIENLDEASTYLIILIDLANSKIYCGRRYARLVNVISETGQLSERAIRRKIVYNENSTAQLELFNVVVPEIKKYQEFLVNRDVSGLFDMLNISHNHSEHDKINKIGRERHEE